MERISSEIGTGKASVSGRTGKSARRVSSESVEAAAARPTEAAVERRRAMKSRDPAAAKAGKAPPPAGEPAVAAASLRPHRESEQGNPDRDGSQALHD